MAGKHADPLGSPAFLADRLLYEEAIIGALLLAPEYLPQVRARLAPSDFGDAEYRAIYGAICALEDAGKSVDELTVVNGIPDVFDAYTLCSAATERVPSPANAVYYAERLAQIEDSARLSQRLQKARADLHNGTDYTEVITRVEKEVRELQEGRASASGSVRSLADVIASRPAGIERLPTGIRKLDTALGGGICRREMTVVAAAPGSGKTSFAVGVAFSLAAKNHRVLFATYEMSAEDLASERFGRIGQGSDEYLEMVVPNIRFLDAGQSGDYSVQGLLATCPNDVDLIVVDYLQNMEDREQPKDNQHRQLVGITHGLVRLAKRTGAALLACSQLSKEALSKKAVTLGDLKESGSIAERAAAVMFLVRDESESEGGVSTAKCRIGKNRFGAAGISLRLNWSGSSCRYTD